MAKIDSIYDFTDKALVELKSWLEPWWQRRGPSCCDSSVAIPSYQDCTLGSPHLVNYWPMDDASGGAVDAADSIDLSEIASGGFPTYGQTGPFLAEFPARTSIAFGGSAGPAGSTARFESAYGGWPSQWSIESWLYPTAINVGFSNRVFDLMDTSNNGIAVEDGPTDSTLHAIVGNSGSYANVTSSSPLALSTWVHWRLTYDGATLNLYINGALDDTAALTSGWSTGSDIAIGNVTPAPSFSYAPFKGRISDFAIYDDDVTTFCPTVTSSGPGLSSATLGQVLTADGLGRTDWLALITVQTGTPSSYSTPLVFDDTVVTGGLWAWNGSAYQQVGGPI